MPSLCSLSALLPLERIIFYFLTRRLFSLLLFLFLSVASTIYIPVLPPPCSSQWMPFLFLLLNSRHLFFLYFFLPFFFLSSVPVGAISALSLYLTLPLPFSRLQVSLGKELLHTSGSLVLHLVTGFLWLMPADTFTSPGSGRQ